PSASCISLSTYGGDASSTVFTRHSTEARELVPSASPLVLATSGRERGYACSRRHSAQPSGVTSSWIDTIPFVWRIHNLRLAHQDQRGSPGNLRPIATQGVAQVMFVTMSRFKSRPTREVIAMMTPPSPRTLDTSSDKARTLSHVANQDLLHEGYFKQSE